MKKKLRSEFNSRQYMLSKDFELYYYSDIHFSTVGLHSHPYTEIYLFCEGEVEMEINDRSYPLRPGNILVLPPQVEHRAVVQSGDTIYRRFVFWLSEDFCKMLRSESPDYLYLFDHVRVSQEYIYPMDTLEFNSLRSKLFQILEELHTDRFGRDTQIGLNLRDLLLTLNRIIRQRKNARSRKETISSFQAIMDYIAGHLEADLSLDTLSRELFLNKYYIAHLVQENTGISLHQYITKKRLAACVDALAGGQRISEVCSQFGFPNYSGFYRAFLKEYGCSPRVYLLERSSPTLAESQ